MYEGTDGCVRYFRFYFHCYWIYKCEQRFYIWVNRIVIHQVGTCAIFFSWFLRLCVSVVAQKILLLPYLLIQKEKYVLQTYHFMIRRFALEFCLRLNLIKPRAIVVQFPSVYTILQTSKKQILRWNLWILALDEMAEQFVWNLLRLQFSSILGRLISPWLLVITMGYVLYTVSSSFL